MELDELKKSWNVLDAQLQKEPIADEERIKELIAGYKANTRVSMGCILNSQRFSLIIGVVVILLAIVAAIIFLPNIVENEKWINKLYIIGGFIVISIIVGFWWDWKTYQWNKKTEIDKMSVAEVSRRMTIFRSWTRTEVWITAIWAVLFTILFYWVMEYYLQPVIVQVTLISILTIFDILIIYFIYKKMIYKHLDSINKNIEELKDICTE
ncbi:MULTISPECIES: hypothetical protein [Bacteroides]|jgi:hypothetical protein|uniref:hypothetical protein n=1 Tax=Bacteroides TaxID=816 RepID=UPI000E443339|nr:MULTISPECIES: hypothetical protein [Bacteroides]RGM47328.1 hypothetical protein DXC10_08655 [Bacteroides sp. OM08-11]